MSAPGTTSPPSEASRRHARRRTQARAQLVGVLLLVVAAFGFVLTFALDPQYRTRWPELIGVLFGGGVAVVLLFAAVWGRQNWARYILLAGLTALSAIFGLYLLALLTNPADANGPGVRALGFGLACLLGALAWLAISKRIRFLTTPPGSGG